MKFRLLVMLAVLVVSVPAWASPPDRAEPLSDKIKKEQQALDKLKGEIQEKKRKSDEAQRKEASVLQSIEEADHRLKLRRDELAKVNIKLKQKDRELEVTNTALYRLKNRIEERQGSIRSRLRVMYKEGPEAQAKLLWGARDYHDFMERSALLLWISRREYQMLEGYRADLARLESTDAKLQSVRGELLGYQRDIADKLAEVREERGHKDHLLARVRGEKAFYEKAVGELEKSAQRLETLLREFESRRKATASIRPDAAGEVLGRLKGRLVWPSDGEVVALFGRQKHPKFDTYVQRKGIEIRASQGSIIRSVFDGVVVFADWMRGYGQLAIVDHGEGYFSLYAHASKFLVSVGEAVRSHQPIGEIGDTGLTGESTLYFELRQGGEALDPLLWLAKRR